MQISMPNRPSSRNSKPFIFLLLHYLLGLVIAQRELFQFTAVDQHARPDSPCSHLAALDERPEQPCANTQDASGLLDAVEQLADHRLFWDGHPLSVLFTASHVSCPC